MDRWDAKEAGAGKRPFLALCRPAEDGVAVLAQLVPMQRVADPDEIKGLALLLASPASAFITGTVIPIDGGATAGS